MGMAYTYEAIQPDRSSIDSLKGPTVLEFGTNWCGFCQAAQVAISAVFTDYPNVRHIKVEDGPGRPLGRSFSVKLWPTLIFMLDGTEVARVVRPADEAAVRQGMAAIT